MDISTLLPELLKGLLHFTWGNEVMIGAANEHGIAMIFTGMRHFRH